MVPNEVKNKVVYLVEYLVHKVCYLVLYNVDKVFNLVQLFFKASSTSRFILCLALLSYYPFLPALVCLGHPLFVLASSNQRLAIRLRLIIMRAGYWGEVARVVVVE